MKGSDILKMGRLRGFLLKHRVSTLFRRISFPVAHCRLNQPHISRFKPLCGLVRWTRKLRAKAKAVTAKNMVPSTDFIQFKQEQVLEKPVSIPKGHIAVYVGQKDGDFQRILVPVVYFNDPLFGDLLKESANEYGFDQPGGLTIPCRISEFERIQTRIKTGKCTRKLLRRKNPNSRSLMG